MISYFLNLLFPQKCINCQMEDGLLCQNCSREIIFQPRLLKNKNQLLTFIAMKKTLLLKKVIHRFKYNFKEELGDLLGDFLLRTIISFKNNFSNTILVPIPIHHSKRFSRGFNQTEILSNYLSKQLNIKTINLLSRSNRGLVQAGLSREERLSNVKNIFVVNQKYLNPEIRSKEIIIIDDVLTTGATLENAYLELKKQGFEKIEALVICHGL